MLTIYMPPESSASSSTILSANSSALIPDTYSRKYYNEFEQEVVWSLLPFRAP